MGNDEIMDMINDYIEEFEININEMEGIISNVDSALGELQVSKKLYLEAFDNLLNSSETSRALPKLRKNMEVLNVLNEKMKNLKLLIEKREMEFEGIFGKKTNKILDEIPKGENKTIDKLIEILNLPNTNFLEENYVELFKIASMLERDTFSTLVFELVGEYNNIRSFNIILASELEDKIRDKWFSIRNFGAALISLNKIPQSAVQHFISKDDESGLKMIFEDEKDSVIEIALKKNKLPENLFDKEITNILGVIEFDDGKMYYILETSW